MAETERSWVWVASTASAQAGKLSVLACVETVAMVALYWGIALIWDTHVHLLAGLLVMPLMLFRSDESVALGVRWADGLDEAIGELDEDFVALCSVFSLVAMALVVFFGQPLLLVFASLVALHVFCLMAFKYLSDLIGAFKLRADLRKVLFLIGVPAFAFSYVVFYSVGPIVFRFLASVKCLKAGVSQIARNWRRIILNVDCCVAPQPLPVLDGATHPWSYEQFLQDAVSDWSEARSKRTVFHLFGSAVVIAAFSPAFLTTILFRWALKSTAWFYLPLLFLTKPFDGGDRIIWMRSFPRTGWTLVRLVLAIVGIGVALAALVVDLPAALRALQLGRALELPVLPLSLLVVLDWSALRPWHYVSLPTALLTVTMFFRLDHLHRREQAGAKIAEDGWALRSMVWADRARSALAIVWLILITPPTLRFFHCAGQLPAWPARQLARLFGPEACGVPLAF
ncbi:MAG: hypothetical protein AAFY52_02990 [Pseudomonadota bacterium]